VAETLRRIHEGPPIPGRFDSFRVVEAYAETATAHGVAVPDGFAWAQGVAGRIEAARAGADPVPCHNDLLNANFLDDGAIRIVDWEYAGMGDRFFDLANFSINHEFDAAANAALLEAYFGELRNEDARALRLMRFMSDFREAMWGVVQQGISELDFDFVAYATEHFERLRRTAALTAATASSCPTTRRCKRSSILRSFWISPSINRLTGMPVHLPTTPAISSSSTSSLSMLLAFCNS